MIILTKNILKRKKQKFSDTYDDDDRFSIHNLMKPNTPTTIQPPKMMKKGIPREFSDIATNTDTTATATRETDEKLYNDANQQLNMTIEAFKVKENQDNMFKIMLKNFWHNTHKRNEPTRTQATQTLKNQRDAMVSAFTTMLDNNKPPEPLPKKPPDEEDSDEEEKKFKLTKMIEIMLHNGATVVNMQENKVAVVLLMKLLVFIVLHLLLSIVLHQKVQQKYQHQLKTKKKNHKKIILKNHNLNNLIYNGYWSK